MKKIIISDLLYDLLDKAGLFDCVEVMIFEGIYEKLPDKYRLDIVNLLLDPKVKK